MKLFAFARHWTDAAASTFGRWPPIVHIWLAAVTLTAIFAIFALVLYASWTDVRSAAWIASGNLASAVSRDIEREFELLDMSVQDLRDAAANPRAMALAPELRRLVLFDRAASAPGLGPLLLLDAEGRVVEEAGNPVALPIDLSRESYFQIHAARSDAGLFVSRPFVSLVDGEKSIAISRRVDRQGVFAGVAVGTIRVSYFQELFANLDLGAHGSMSLMFDDGTLVVRRPFVQAAARVALDFATAARLATSRVGTFEAVSPLDDVRREYFFARVGTLPLVQFVGRSVRDIYAAWWQRAALTALAMLLLGNAILLLVVVLNIELRRRRVAEAELAVLAATDKLTGLANRRRFDEGLEGAWQRAKRDHASVALLLIDIDHFKAFNDAVGHQGGDAVLAMLGTCLGKSAAGPDDLAARYGGEEFVILLPDADVGHARDVAESLRGRLAELGQPHPRSPIGRLTISIGAAAALPSEGSAPADLLRAADLALYQAKRTGRNKVVTAAQPDALAA